MSQEKVVAVYDTLPHAEAAVNTLKSAGYFASDISVTSRERDAAARSDRRHGGYWKRLLGRPLELHERKECGPMVPQGGVAVTVRVPESEALRVVKLLKGDEPIDGLGQRLTHSSSAGAGAPKVIVPPPTSFPGDDK